jgi:hypothetical protein
LKSNIDGLVKSRKNLFSVIPADPGSSPGGIQYIQYVLDTGSGLPRTGYGVRHDDFETFYEIVNIDGPVKSGSGLPRTGYGVRHDDFETFYEIVNIKMSTFFKNTYRKLNKSTKTSLENCLYSPYEIYLDRRHYSVLPIKICG